MSEPHSHTALSLISYGPFSVGCRLVDQFRSVGIEDCSLANCLFTSPSLPPPVPSVPGGWAAEAPGREEGARARGDPESLWGEQQLHKARQGEAGAEDGGQQGEQGGPAGCYAGAAAGEGTVSHQCAALSTVYSGGQEQLIICVLQLLVQSKIYSFWSRNVVVHFSLKGPKTGLWLDCLSFINPRMPLCVCVCPAGQARWRSEEEQGDEGGGLPVDEPTHGEKKKMHPFRELKNNNVRKKTNKQRQERRKITKTKKQKMNSRWPGTIPLMFLNILCKAKLVV